MVDEIESDNNEDARDVDGQRQPLTTKYKTRSNAATFNSFS